MARVPNKHNNPNPKDTNAKGQRRMDKEMPVDDLRQIPNYKNLGLSLFDDDYLDYIS